ncbi:hypothetical protein HPP92_007483 [Vanilla planifolia]|uniref:UBX domain-containing protein n=1 Tax=Vanilla planifolia TaxID=51239 RepID=A0A835RMJ0_VANPL|nr:hypothetical protein HPP92_007483 [Vanilla planifolia]
MRALCSNLMRKILRLGFAILDGLSRMTGHETPGTDPWQQQNEGRAVIPEWCFLNLFEQEYGRSHPFFYATRFMEVLQIAKNESNFPFCAVVAPSAGKDFTVLQKVEGPVSPEALVEILQRTLQDQGSALTLSAAEEAEKIRIDRRLRQEQDEAYLAALKKDKEKEEKKGGNAQGVPRRPAQEPSAPKLEEVVERIQRKESINLRNVQLHTKLVIRFPDGARKEKMFLSTDTVRSIYKFVDSLEVPRIGSYRLISNFPRRVYGHEQLDLTLTDAGLHPNAALFLELIH